MTASQAASRSFGVAFLGEAPGVDDEELGAVEAVDLGDPRPVLGVDDEGAEIGMVVDDDEVDPVPLGGLVGDGGDVGGGGR